MKIYELLDKKKGIFCLSGVVDYNELFSQIVPLNIFKGMSQKDIILKILKREKMTSTGIGRGIAVPHVKIHGLGGSLVRIAVLDNGIEYDALDKKPCDIFFLIIASGENGDLRLLAKAARIISDKNFVQDLRRAGSPEKIFALLQAKEGKD